MSALSARLRGADGVHAALAGVVIVAGIAVRAALLGAPMRYDEAFSFERYAMLPQGVIRHLYDLPNNHVLNSLLMHLAWDVLGVRTLTVRLAAFLLGAAVPVAGYAAARVLYGPRAALWAAALLAGSGPLVEFSANGRGYAPGIALMLVALWAGALILRGRRLWPVPVLAVAGALAAYAVPTIAFGLAAGGLFLGASALLRRRPDPRTLAALAVGVAAGGLLALLLYAPLRGQPGWTIQPPLPDLWPYKRDLIKQTWAIWNRTTPHPLDWLIAIGFVVSLAAHRRLARDSFPLGLAGLIAGGAVLLTSRVPPFPRGFVALLPVYLLAAAAGLSWLADLALARLPRARAALAGGAVAVVVAVAMAVTLLHAGLLGSEEPPQSDTAIVPYVRDQLKAPEVLMNQFSFAPAVNFYFMRDGYPGGRGNVTPAMLAAGHAVTIVEGDRPEEAAGTVASVGGRPAGPPRLLRRFEFISVWDVPVGR